jgi:CRISPR-associated protein Cmr4
MNHLLFVHALSPLHAGTGQGIGIIDLPIAREKATGIPYLPGSSIKGSVRDLCDSSDHVKNNALVSVFGPNTVNASDHAGSAQFGDARLVLLPVRSLAGTFAWVTSPYLLERCTRDASAAGLIAPEIPNFDPDKCLITSDSVLKVGTTGKVILEDLDLKFDAENALTADWAKCLALELFQAETTLQDMLKKRFCIVSNDTLSFLLETATEITARIRLDDDTKTVVQGGLWYEESLPTESVLISLVRLEDSRADTEKYGSQQLASAALTMIDKAIQKPVQLGGKATVGRGLCKLRLTRGNP